MAQPDRAVELASSHPSNPHTPQIESSVNEPSEQIHGEGDNHLEVALTSSHMASHDDGFLSPMTAADGNHFSPYAHLSDHLSDSAYDNFSEYDYTTQEFGDDHSDFFQSLLDSDDNNQSSEQIAQSHPREATSDVASTEPTSGSGDSIKHPSTRLISPVLTNPSFSRTGTPGGLAATGDAADASSARADAMSANPQSAFYVTDTGPSTSLGGTLDADRDIQAQYEENRSAPTTFSNNSKQGPKENMDSQFTPKPVKLEVLEPVENEAETAQNRRGIDPEARSRMNQETIPSLEDQKKERDLAVTKEGVVKWLTTTDVLGSVPDVTSNDQSTARKGDPGENSIEIVPTSQVETVSTPGPGVFVNHDEDDTDDDEDEESEAGFSELDDTTPPAPPNAKCATGTPSDVTGPRDPGAGRRPWTDSPIDPDSASISGQPASSNAAIARFEKRAKDTETASVTATIGSSHHRRSLESLFSSTSLSGTARISVVPPSETGSISNSSRVPASNERQNGLFSKFLHRGRSYSNQRKRRDMHESESKPSEIQEKKESPALSPVQRVHSFGRSKSPSIGPSSPNHTPISPNFHHHPKTSTGLAPAWASVTGAIRRARSRSDLSDRSALAEQWASAGGPPAPILRPSSPSQEAEQTNDPKKPMERQDSGLAVDDDDEHTPTGPVDMSLGPLNIPTDSTPESFRAHALEANPRIHIFLLERITSEQIKRYRRLVEYRLNHMTQIKNGKCESKDYCGVLGRGPRSLPPNKSGNEQESTFYIQRPGPNGEAPGPTDDDSLPANFPEGIPLPPIGVDRLPAEFECPLCFKVKKIRKPSDWTKHVHEDLQPFTCSFPDCTEPKSFKRKADWVRHENERHRQLETWVCSFADCQHVCHRKDNFVQHLVREHKMPEPKIRASRGAADTGVDHGSVSRLVELCRRDTARDAEAEPCRFCGNYLKTWKKLSGHLAKHMEHVSLPVLTLAAQSGAKQGELPSSLNQALVDSNRATAGRHYTQSNLYSHSTAQGPKFQEYGLNLNANGYGPVRQPVASTMPPLITTSLPGTTNVSQEFGHDLSYTTASPNETMGSAFNDNRNILPGSFGQGISMTYPPTLMPHGPHGHTSPNLHTGMDQQNSLYANNQLYGGEFGSQHYGQQSYQYSQIPVTTSGGGPYVSSAGAQYTALDTAYTAPFPAAGPTQLATTSGTPSHQYTAAHTAAYSASSSPFPQHQTYVQPHQQSGSSQAYVSAPQGQGSGYFPPGGQYNAQAGRQVPNGGQLSAHPFHQQRQQAQQQQQTQPQVQYGRYYGT